MHGAEIALLLSAMRSQLKKPSEQTHWNDNLVCVCTHREYLEACQPRIKAVVVISFSRATWKESGEESGISSLFSPTRRRPGSRVTWCFVMGAYRMIQQELDSPSDWFTFKHKQERGCSRELHRGMKRSPKFLSSKSKNAFLFNSSSQLPAALCTHYCAYWLGLFEARTLNKKKKMEKRRFSHVTTGLNVVLQKRRAWEDYMAQWALYCAGSGYSRYPPNPSQETATVLLGIMLPPSN